MEATQTQPQLLVTAERAAEILSIPRSRVFELIARGEIRSVLVGRSRRVSIRSLTEYVDRLDADAVR